MADIFSYQDARNLLQNKFIFMLGDSNMRATYKDLVLLINRNQILDIRALRGRGEESFEGDKRITFSGMSRGRQYVEGREFVNHGVHIEYHFITRCYTNEIEQFFQKIKDGIMKPPDVIIMNSCIWDISRWGPTGVETYKDNMKSLMLLLDRCIPKKTLFIWMTTLPVSTVLQGQVLIKQIDFLQNLLRFEVMEANLFCRQLVVSHGYDVLDTHYHLRMQIHRRLKDGIHYGPLPVRFISNLLLTHIALSWDVPLPGNSRGIGLKKIIESGCLCEPSQDVELPPFPGILEPANDQSNVASEREKEIRNRPIARAKRQINHFKRRNFNHNAITKQRKQIPTWNNDYSRDWMSSNQPQMDVRPQKFWQCPMNNQRYNAPPVFSPQQQCPQWNVNYCQSEYADFDRVGGPVRNPRYQKKRSGPY